jgi:hypothetical protein
MAKRERVDDEAQRAAAEEAQRAAAEEAKTVEGVTATVLDHYFPVEKKPLTADEADAELANRRLFEKLATSLLKNPRVGASYVAPIYKCWGEPPVVQVAFEERKRDAPGRAFEMYDLVAQTVTTTISWVYADDQYLYPVNVLDAERLSKRQQAVMGALRDAAFKAQFQMD